MSAKNSRRPGLFLIGSFVLLNLCAGIGLNATRVAAQPPAQNAAPEPTPAAVPAAKASPTPAVSAPVSAPVSAAAGAPEEKEDKRIGIDTDVVTLNLTVTDMYGRYVSGLNKSAFTVFDNNVEQKIDFFSDVDAPVSIGILFDISGSMSGDKIAKARQALGRFISTSHPSDEYFLVAFNNRAQLLMDRTRNGDAVLDKLTLVQPKSQTALYDAVYLGVEKVTRGAHQRKAILIISDGQDNNSRYNFTDVRRLLKESDVTVYGVGILSGSDYGSTMGMSGQSFLDELSSVTGGKTFYPNTGVELDEIFERIALELRNQYSIGYYPNDFVPDGKWRKIKVKVKPPRGLPRLGVRSREGYYATPNVDDKF